ncbi:MULTISPECIES: cytochrome c biogenesis CcdA family protein [unclassified Bartonella]|uniref:cytochrome c biogenesis CcdA family protein n=1 Tax=unclassified Bartonella TaxID=2645622 RepID=UPI0015F7BB84|nr:MULTISPECIES: cytochrome c biogenesis protein CcdA [unclassified Bartonella]UXN07309.1 cytochrome c biogenesis protein CcdA [Bartonella sp. HY761]
MEVSFLGAFFGGILSFLSPCVLPLVPPYLCYMAGVSYEELRNKDKKVGFAIDKQILIPAIAFVLGFTLIFMFLGAGASFIGRFLLSWQPEIAIGAGIIIIIMGLHFLGVFRIPLLLREARFQTKKTKSGPVGAFIMGLAFAFGWTPCIGPILTPIMKFAGESETVAGGVMLLAVYSLGLGVPFLLAAVFSSAFISRLASWRVHLGVVEKIIGVLLVFAGVVFLTGQLQVISSWFMGAFPFLQKLG